MTQTLEFTAEDRLILEGYKSVVEAIGKVFGSTCEVVLHSFEDLHHSVICIHNGSKTGRNIGSPVTDKALKMLNECEEKGLATTSVYYTKSQDQHTMRSTSTIIKNTKGQPIGMLCINFDLSTPLSDLLTVFLPHSFGSNKQFSSLVDTSESDETFVSNVDELISINTIKARSQVMANEEIPSRKKTKEIIVLLNSQGVFKLRDSINKVAEILGVSRDAVYLHLRAIKKDASEAHEQH